MSYVPFTEGKVYDVAYLRPFDWELAKQGHPLACHDGGEVSHLFSNEQQDGVFVRHWQRYRLHRAWGSHFLSLSDKGTGHHLRLAPLAVKDGRPLHIGDVIEICPWYCHGGRWETQLIQKPSDALMLVKHEDKPRYGWYWRFKPVA